MRFISQPNMQAGGIVLRIHGHRWDAQIRRRTGNPNGNLTPIGNQQLHGSVFSLLRNDNC